jgi:hypothetical protein
MEMLLIFKAAKEEGEIVAVDSQKKKKIKDL